MDAIRGVTTVAPLPGPDPAATLLGGLVSRFSELVGDGPSYATFHFASQQEGTRLAAGSGPTDLPALLRRVDAMLGHRSVLLEAGADQVRLRVEGSSLLATGGRVGTGILLGLLEGVLAAQRRRPYEGCVEATPGPAAAVLCFRGRAT